MLMVFLRLFLSESGFSKACKYVSFISSRKYLNRWFDLLPSFVGRFSSSMRWHRSARVNIWPKMSVLFKWLKVIPCRHLALCK